MALLYYLSYAAVLAAFAFVTLSLASGLLYVSELIEERSSIAKVVGKRGIYVIIILHGLLYFSESLPLRNTLFSVFCHIVYLQNFSHTWPVISLTSLSFLGSCVLVIADHFLWFFYFARITHEAKRVTVRTYGVHPLAKRVPGFVEIAAFFGICVWLVPLFLFLSLSANDNALPTTAAPASETDAQRMSDARTRSSLFKSIFATVTAYIPGVRLSRRDSSEGIIAPRSPVPLQSFQIDDIPSPGPRRASSISPVPRFSSAPKHLTDVDGPASPTFRFDRSPPPSPRRANSIPPPPRSPGAPQNKTDIDGHRLSPVFNLNSSPNPSLHPTRTLSNKGLAIRRVAGLSLRGDDDDSSQYGFR